MGTPCVRIGTGNYRGDISTGGEGWSGMVNIVLMFTIEEILGHMNTKT